jgi:hypothetical protein
VRFAATPVAIARVLGAVEEPEKLSVGFGIEVMSSVVAQNLPREKMSDSEE